MTEPTPPPCVHEWVLMTKTDSGLTHIQRCKTCDERRLSRDLPK